MALSSCVASPTRRADMKAGNQPAERNSPLADSVALRVRLALFRIEEGKEAELLEQLRTERQTEKATAG